MKKEELKYSKEHEWVFVKGDTATVGITQHASEQLGDIVYLELPEAGESFARDEKVGTIESVKTVSDLFTPVGGEITELNPALLDEVGGESNDEQHFEYLNQDPYGTGWIYKIKMSDPGETDALMSYEQYEEMIAG